MTVVTKRKAKRVRAGEGVDDRVQGYAGALCRRRFLY